MKLTEEAKDICDNYINFTSSGEQTDVTPKKVTPPPKKRPKKVKQPTPKPPLPSKITKTPKLPKKTPPPPKKKIVPSPKVPNVPKKKIVAPADKKCLTKEEVSTFNKFGISFDGSSEEEIEEMPPWKKHVSPPSSTYSLATMCTLKEIRRSPRIAKQRLPYTNSPRDNTQENEKTGSSIDFSVKSDGGNNFKEMDTKRFQYTVLMQMLKQQESIKNLEAQVSKLGRRIEPESSVFHFKKLETLADLRNFEEILQDERKRQLCISRLSQVGGNDLKDCVRNVVNACMTTAVQSNFNMVGRGQMGKHAFSQTRLYGCVRDSLLQSVKGSTENNINQTMGTMLKRAKPQTKVTGQTGDDNNGIMKLPQ